MLPVNDEVLNLLNVGSIRCCSRFVGDTRKGIFWVMTDGDVWEVDKKMLHSCKD